MTGFGVQPQNIVIGVGFRWFARFLNPPTSNFKKKFFHSILIDAAMLMASLVIYFFSSLILSNQRTNFCKFVTKMNKIAKTAGFPGTKLGYKPRVQSSGKKFVYKAQVKTSRTKLLELYYDDTAKFSPILKETFKANNNETTKYQIRIN